MQVQEALQQAQAQLQYAMELLKTAVDPEESFRWDNQVTAMENFLANTETVALDNLLFRKLRQNMLVAKKKLMNQLMAHEAELEGESYEEPEEDSEEDQVEGFLDMAEDVIGLVRESLEQKVNDVKELPIWEEPLSVVNGYLADSEPLQNANKDLRRARSVVRAARKELQGKIEDVVAAWREADRKNTDDDE